MVRILNASKFLSRPHFSFSFSRSRPKPTTFSLINFRPKSFHNIYRFWTSLFSHTKTVSQIKGIVNG